MHLSRLPTSILKKKVKFVTKIETSARSEDSKQREGDPSSKGPDVPTGTLIWYRGSLGTEALRKLLFPVHNASFAMFKPPSSSLEWTSIVQRYVKGGAKLHHNFFVASLPETLGDTSPAGHFYGMSRSPFSISRAPANRHTHDRHLCQSSDSVSKWSKSTKAMYDSVEA